MPGAPNHSHGAPNHIATDVLDPRHAAALRQDYSAAPSGQRQDKVEYLAKVGIGYGAKQAASLTWPVGGWGSYYPWPYVLYMYIALI